ncbi:MAG: hypothetical protein U5K30_08925 [Acidimicrobiales bacterium]|nr:hypothetical protein [Acidimicrobiales bacterium]
MTPRALALRFAGAVTCTLLACRGESRDDEVVDCPDERITDAAIEDLFVESFRSGEADAEAAFAPAIDACT